MSAFEASKYKPLDKTYTIRIFSSRIRPNIISYEETFKLKDSSNYIKTECYSFDHLYPEVPLYSEVVYRRNENLILFNEDIAKKMLLDFLPFEKSCNTLLIHCAIGKNRSPAVGIAFNEIFNLGHNDIKLKEKFPEANWHVYGVLKNTAKKIL